MKNNLKPILFSTPMVQAILRGEKTQTRRLESLEEINKQPNDYEFIEFGDFGALFKNLSTNQYVWVKQKKYIGDTLWVRETWQHTKCLNINPEDENYGYVYKADGQPWKEIEEWVWKSSIFMPKNACRIFLKLTNIRIERLQNISKADAIAEGIERWTEERLKSKPEDFCSYTSDPIDSYETLWQKINGEKSWDENPWVWVYDFEN
jgi:hypothetical protein